MKKQFLEFLRGPAPRAVRVWLYDRLADALSTLAVLPLVWFAVVWFLRDEPSAGSATVLAVGLVGGYAIRRWLRLATLRRLVTAAAIPWEERRFGLRRLLPYAAAALAIAGVILAVSEMPLELAAFAGLLALVCVLLWIAPWLREGWDRAVPPSAVRPPKYESFVDPGGACAGLLVPRGEDDGPTVDAGSADDGGAGGSCD